MMFLLFLSFISIKITSILGTFIKDLKSIIWLLFIKVIALPTLVYLVFRAIYPQYALGTLLLTGVSTGVVAPFIATIVSANISLVLVMVVISSIIVPITLPVLVDILVGHTIDIPLLDMMRVLSLVVFVPLFCLEFIRKLAPGFIQALDKKKFPISLMNFAIINLGVFSKYSEFFHQNPMTILEATLVSLVLGTIYFFMGILLFLKKALPNQLASAISLANMNNVLVIVFSSDFFGPLEPTLAAVYMIPFFGIIFPLRIYEHRRFPHDR
ncbi:bile acid:sodium symporter family protein [Thermodesulfobacteriota bacterium]